MVLERVVSYLGTSVSERTVASIFRLQLPCIALVAVVVLWYVMCGFYVGDSVSERPVASIFRLKLPCIALVDVMVLWYVICVFLCRYQRFGASCCLHLQIKITV